MIISRGTVINVVVQRNQDVFTGAPFVVVVDFDHEEVWHRFIEENPREHLREVVRFDVWLIRNGYVRTFDRNGGLLLKYRIETDSE